MYLPYMKTEKYRDIVDWIVNACQAVHWENYIYKLIKSTDQSLKVMKKL